MAFEPILPHSLGLLLIGIRVLGAVGRVSGWLTSTFLLNARYKGCVTQEDIDKLLHAGSMEDGSWVIYERKDEDKVRDRTRLSMFSTFSDRYR